MAIVPTLGKTQLESSRLPSVPRIGWGNLRREPFRILFPSAVLAGCVGIGHWLAYAMGLVGSYSGAFHASMQVGVYLGAFVAGFMMTALPNFSGAPPASTSELAGVLLLLATQVIALAFGRWTVADIAFGALLLFLVLFIVRRLRLGNRRAAPPIEFLWLPLAFLHGVAGVRAVQAVSRGSGSRFQFRPPSWCQGRSVPLRAGLFMNMAR